jgi:uncharacterized protein (TIGR02145 family)
LLRYNGTKATNADRLKIYLNGKQSSLTFSASIPAVLQNPVSASLKFGGDSTLSAYASAKMDEIKIWNYALDDFAIKADYNGGEVRFGEKNWSCGASKLIDIDGNSYRTVQIGTQCWMAENLRVSRNANGTKVNGTGDSNTTPPIRYDSIQWEAAEGYFYNWQDAMNGSIAAGAQGICPIGWHMPTHDEWTDLERYICVSEGRPTFMCDSNFPKDTSTTGYRGTNEGTELKADNNVNGVSSDPLGDDGYGFSALMVGQHHTGGACGSRGVAEYFWTSSEAGISTNAWYRTLTPSNAGVSRDSLTKANGFSVRCLKD